MVFERKEHSIRQAYPWQAMPQERCWKCDQPAEFLACLVPAKESWHFGEFYFRHERRTGFHGYPHNAAVLCCDEHYFDALDLTIAAHFPDHDGGSSVGYPLRLSWKRWLTEETPLIIPMSIWSTITGVFWKIRYHGKTMTFEEWEAAYGPMSSD